MKYSILDWILELKDVSGKTGKNPNEVGSYSIVSLYLGFGKFTTVK